MEVLTTWTTLFTATEDCYKTVQNLGGNEVEFEVASIPPTTQTHYLVLRNHEFKDTFVKSGQKIYARSRGLSGSVVSVTNFSKGGGAGTGGGTGDLILGETSTTAYRGDRGKIAYEHSQELTGNPHGTTKSDIGLSNVDNTSDMNKPVSTATLNMINDLKEDKHLFSIRRLTATQSMQSNTPLVMNGTVISYPTTENKIQKVENNSFSLEEGSNYRVSISNMFVQGSGGTSSFILTLQYSRDGGDTWQSHPISRNINIVTNNETIDPAMIFKVYKSELTVPTTLFRLLPTSLNGGVNYTVGVEIEQL
jgi:hypothetical protein